MTVGEKIRKIRKEKQLTQKQLSDLCGINEVQIRRYELNGKNSNPKLETLQKIANALNVSIFEFLDNDLFDAATAPISMENALYEAELLSAKLKSIEENESLSNEEKRKLVLDFALQTEIMADIHLNNAEDASKFLLNKLFEQLNSAGKEKAIEQVEMLTKIPEFRQMTLEEANEYLGTDISKHIKKTSEFKLSTLKEANEHLGLDISKHIEKSTTDN